MTDNGGDLARAVERKNITLKQAAQWYGVSERTLRRRIAEGRLRAYRVGPRSIRVSVEDLEALARRIPSAG
jgi:excisionase family DNA binding protein